MALTNFTLPFGGLTTTNWAATISPLQPHHATAVNNLLYGPAGHQESDEPPIGVSHDDYYKNNPYSPPQNQQYRSKSNNYLPPPPPPPPHSQQQPSPRRIGPTQQSRQPGGAGQQQYGSPDSTYTPQGQPGRTYGEGKYSRVPTTSSVQQNTQYQFNNYNKNTRTFNTQQTGGVGTGLRSGLGAGIGSAGSGLDGGQGTGSGTGIGTGLETGLGTAAGNQQSSTGLDGSSLSGSGGSDAGTQQPGQGYPIRPPGYTRVQAGQGTRTQVHAVLDYDADEGEEADYYDDNEDGTSAREDGKSTPTVTPIQGPIFLKNGTVPVVPLFSYPTLNNGTFVQIPIWWTALSVALGLDIRGDIVRGVPCVKRYHQLFCPTAGNSYPIDKIEKFIDDNKALMRRMYGDFEMTPGFIGPTNRKRRRSIDEPDFFDLSGVPGIINRPGDDLELVPDTEHGETYFGKLRKKRQNTNFRGGGNNNQNNKRTQKLPMGPGANPNESSTGRVDACESKIEIVTPYWAANSAGKIRAIVNTQHFEQAIHQEICTTKVQTARCSGDCGCEQKYKWHRLLAYDPDNDCKGIFMDWFLFPSCCVCRCQP